MYINPCFNKLQCYLFDYTYCCHKPSSTWYPLPSYTDTLLLCSKKFHYAAGAISLLDADTKEDLVYQLRVNYRQIKEKFASFVASLCTAVIATQVSFQDFKLYVLGLSAFPDQDGKHPNLLDPHTKAKIEEADSIHNIFGILINMHCCSIMDINIFQSIMKKYDIKADSQDLRYSDHLTAYINKHEISELMKIFPGVSGKRNSKKVTLKFDIKLFGKVSKLIELKTAIADIMNLNPSAFQLISIEEGCVVVTFLVPEAVAEHIFKMSLTETQKADIKALSVNWLKCENFTLYDINDVKSKSEHLLKQVLSTEDIESISIENVKPCRSMQVLLNFMCMTL